MFGIIHKMLLNHYRKKGLQLGESSTILGRPKLGSEPYLISIGENVTVTSNVTFITHDGGTRVFRSESKYKGVIKFGRITIHDNSFIGHSAIIMPGVSIGPNSVVAAGSIVTKDVAPNQVYGGSPAKFITTVENYAEKSLENSPVYNKEKWKSNKKEELLRIFPYPW